MEPEGKIEILYETSEREDQTKILDCMWYQKEKIEILYEASERARLN